jgi:predicted RNA binding protein YcfA (HicA-like mRNA interferase family)
MPRFPRDAPQQKVLAALCKLGFEVVREAEHIALRRINPDGSVTPMTIPNHRTYKSSTLRLILTQVGISRERFMRAYYGSRS